MPSPLYLLNFILLQWFFIRLGRKWVVDIKSKEVRDAGWTLVYVWPLTGWWNPHRYWSFR